jgi:hypothetical protein
LSNGYIDVGRKIFVQLVEKFLEHVVPLGSLDGLEDLRDVDEIADELWRREENLMVSHIV